MKTMKVYLVWYNETTFDAETIWGVYLSRARAKIVQEQILSNGMAIAARITVECVME